MGILSEMRGFFFILKKTFKTCFTRYVLSDILYPTHTKGVENMRMWSVRFFQYLPKKQLRGQWSELSGIAGRINDKGTPNHLLVNKVINYTVEEFMDYAGFLVAELDRRGMRYDNAVLEKIINVDADAFNSEATYSKGLYKGWHDNRYMRQCMYNLQEKYDCGGVDDSSWANLVDQFGFLLDLEEV